MSLVASADPGYVGANVEIFLGLWERLGLLAFSGRLGVWRGDPVCRECDHRECLLRLARLNPSLLRGGGCFVLGVLMNQFPRPGGDRCQIWYDQSMCSLVCCEFDK